MATGGAMNSDSTDMIITSIKVEFDMVKPEPPELLECAVCITRSADCADISTTTTTFGTPLLAFLGKYSRCDLVTESSGQICKTCLNVIAVLEQAELEYLKLKESFEAIISKNPLFDNRLYQGIPPVKLEFTEIPCERRNDDSEDEPLAVTRKRKVFKTKKKPCVRNKRKPRAQKDNIAVNNNKKSTRVAENVSSDVKNVKKEDTQDSIEDCNNTLDDLFKVEMDGFNDNENDSDFFPDDDINGDEEVLIPRRGRPKGSGATLNKRKHKKDSKTIYECDQCNAKYTTAKRLELHKDKHLGGKPPYICEVCGASYKHKRACDIHVGLHKGISDWKCEECNKLFPSKGALQRHNNIHTGKLNYQCDLCGKSFIHTSSFKMHKLSHSGVKPHACDICGLALMTRSHLKRHKRIHSGEKRHECKICGKRFSERYNLVAHSKSHEAAGEAAAVPAPRRRLFRCAFCQDRFERRYMLERHMAAVHGRTLERAPATPRNTMSKLLKAQAQARSVTVPPPPALTPAPSAASDVTETERDTETKQERSPSPRAPLGGSLGGGGGGGGGATPKFQLMSAATIVTSGSWSGAYAAEFGLRHDFPH